MSLARHIAVMRNAPLLRLLPDEGLKLLAFGSEVQVCKPRQTLHGAGDAADGAVLVLGGKLQLLAPLPATEPAVLGVGQLIDELALFVPTTRPATAVAQTSCEVLALPRTQMHRILDEYPDAAAAMQTLVARRAHAFIEEVGNLTAGARR